MASVRSRRRKGGTFWFVVDRHGQERHAGPGREGEKAARRWQGRLEAAEWAERRGEPVETALGASWTLRELRDRDLAATAGRASWPSRKRRWAVLLEGFGEAVRLDRLTPAAIQGFVATRLRTATAQTVRNDLSLLSSAFKFARRMRQESGLTVNPVADVDRPAVTARREVQLGTDAEVRAIIRAAWAKARGAPGHLRDLWRDNAAIIELCYETSSRISQVLTLRRAQVAGGVLRFPPHKGGLAREFPVVGRIEAVLRKLPARGEFFFPARVGSGKPHRDNLAKFWRAVAPAGFTIHGLRHSSITAALEAGESPTDAARRGGWKSLAMLIRTYGHILRAPIRQLPRRAGQKTAATPLLPRRSRAVKEGKKGKLGKVSRRPAINPGRVSTAPRTSGPVS